jgi:hypothetical protein
VIDSEPEGESHEDKPPAPPQDIGVKDARPVDDLPPKDHQAIKGADLKELTKLKKFYGRWILWLMAAQLVVVNAVFVVYAWSGYNWRPPHRVVEVWLTATFVQVVSIVVVITRSLFPRGTADHDEDSADDSDDDSADDS